MTGPFSDLGRPPLGTSALRRALLDPAGPIARLEVLDEVGSTNAALRERALAEGPAAWPHLSVLTTDHQSAGRGRLDRTWVTPPRSAVAVSVLVRADDVPAAAWTWLPLLAGLSVTTALRRTAGVDAVVKWPNDVLVRTGGDDGRGDGGRGDGGRGGDGRDGGGRDGDGGDRDGAGPRGGKVAGILAELLPAAADGAPGGSPAAIIGIGINATTTAAELPVATATSLALAGAATTDRGVVLRAVLRALAEDLTTWRAAGGDVAASGLADRVREVCDTLGRDVQVHLPDGVLEGAAEGLDDDGRLLVRPTGPAPAGSPDVVALGAGDVVHLR